MSPPGSRRYVSAAKRAAAAPEVSTIAESGVPGFETGSWQGVLAAGGTPPEVVIKLNAEIRRILGTPDLKQQLAAQGTEVLAGTPEAMAAFIRSEIVRWAKIVKQSGARFDQVTLCSAMQQRR
jgi:tripartite-type tricarboxylate transporter receptor subunit TctC